MYRLTGYVLVFVLHFYIFVNADEIQREKRTLEDCDCGITTDDVNSYYTEGSTPVTKGTKYPWMVALRNKGSVQCSGAVITRSFILTAGHCVHGDPMPKNQQCRAPLKEVTPGRCVNFEDLEIAFIYKKADLKKFYPVRDVIIHPEYQIVEGNNGEYTKNDIALIKMAGAVACVEYRKPVCLPFNKNFVTPGRRSFITGWGVTEPPGSKNGGNAEKPELTSGVLTVQQQGVCTASMEHVKNDASFCAKGNVSACKGDSGAPLITDGEDGRFYILGVTSHLAAPGCDAEHPQFFANVKVYLKWILDHVMCCP